MFGNATEKRVMREASKIVSLKEDADIVSWERVLEIGKQLQEQEDGEAHAELGGELRGIAEASLALYSRFGIEPAPSARVMPSGIEVLEGGLAEAALAEQQAALVEERADEDAPGDDARSGITVPVHRDQLLSKTRSIESLRSEASWDELLGSNVEEGPEASGEECEPFEPEEPPLFAEVDEAVEPPCEPEVESAPEPEPEPEPKPDSDSEPPAPEPEIEPLAPELEPEPDSEPAPEPSPRERFARFHMLYESRDRGLCVFEDEYGHLVAVDASKLA